MTKGRLEAFTDGVVAIIITIMVLELKVPHGADITALQAGLPIFLTYVLSYINIGIFWSNHHHMLHATERVDVRILWANLFLLFWLSLVPFVIRWIDEAGFKPLPVAAYGVVLAMAAIGYTLLQSAIIARNGRSSALATAVGTDLKGKLSYPWPCTSRLSRLLSSKNGSLSSSILRSRFCGLCPIGALNQLGNEN